MKLLIGSRAFYPSVGGLEIIGRGLATKWLERGQEVKVITETPLNKNNEVDNLDVIRRPSVWETLQIVRWADVFVQNGDALRSFLFPLLTQTSFIAIHHTSPIRGNSKIRDTISQWCTYLRTMNVAVSASVKQDILGPVTHIPNFFRPTFDQIGTGPGDENREGLLFVGRLVSEKGADVAIDTLHLLQSSGISQTLTICGEGPETTGLKERVQQYGLEDSVIFNGWTSPETLAKLYRRSEVLLVPSRKESREGFGIVAIEAIASGCPVVASDVGGLPEAVGECGLLAEPADPLALAHATRRVLKPEVRADIRDAMPAHVSRHRIDYVAEEYLTLLDSLVESNAV